MAGVTPYAYSFRRYYLNLWGVGYYTWGAAGVYNSEVCVYTVCGCRATPQV